MFFAYSIMKKEASEILQLPPVQLEWLMSVKNLFKTYSFYNDINIKDLTNSIKIKAIEKKYSEIHLLDLSILEDFFKRQNDLIKP